MFCFWSLGQYVLASDRPTILILRGKKARSSGEEDCGVPAHGLFPTSLEFPPPVLCLPWHCSSVLVPSLSPCLQMDHVDSNLGLSHLAPARATQEEGASVSFQGTSQTQSPVGFPGPHTPVLVKPSSFL